MIVLYIFCVVLFKSVASIPRQEILMRHLFEDLRYYKDSSPDNSTTFINVKTRIDHVDKVDEQEQTVTLELRQHFSWTDQRLKWNESHYGGLSYFGCPQDKLWLPDLHVTNSKQGPVRLSGDSLLLVDSSGRVSWTLMTKEPTICNLDVTFYPFDSQTCIVNIGAMLYEIGEQDITEDPELPFELTNQSLQAWSLVSGHSEVKIYNISGGKKYRYIAYTVNIKRERAYYLVSVVLPAIFLSAALPVPFSLPADGGERMGVSVAALTTLSVYFSVVSDDVPRTSRKTPMFAMYLNVLLAIASLCVLLSMAVIRIHGRPSHHRVGNVTKAFVRLILQRKTSRLYQTSPVHGDQSKANVLRESCPNSYHMKFRGTADDLSLPASPNEDNDMDVTWPMVADVIDGVLFSISSIVICLMTLVVLYAAIAY